MTATDFGRELEALINRYSKENGSNTPDFILARFLETVLIAADGLINRRESWYGRNKHENASESDARLAQSPTPAPCESCGNASVGRTLDDVPLCSACGAGLTRRIAQQLKAKKAEKETHG